VCDGFAPELRAVNGARRFSQAIAEGDGISIVVHVDDLGAARIAEEQGAEAVALRRPLDGLDDVSSLPLLWRPHGPPEQARAAGADACVLAPAALGEEGAELERLYRAALDLGLDCVIEVRNEDELQLALERIDPEIFLLSGDGNKDGGPLEQALELLQDVPAGKLALAEVDAAGPDEVAELERAGVDGVIVPAGNVAELAGGAQPQV
jgi:indole-3-glycerol phosphate synthase